MTDPLDPYNVTWNSPSEDASGSMPVGNGDIGSNIWVEPNGDLLLLIGKTDAWDENSSNLKLGRIRISLTPNLLAAGSPFRQTLRLRTGDIEITAGEATVRIWVDANRPVIHVDIDSESPIAVRASLEMWRTAPRTIQTQTGDIFKRLSKEGDPYPTIVTPDRILPDTRDRIVWCHHNEKREHDGYAINMRLQGLGGFLDQMPHPLLGRTFGAAMEGENLSRVDDTTLASTRLQAHRHIAIYPLTVHPSTIDDWHGHLEKTIVEAKGLDPSIARREHERWWAEFWDRSWIYLTSDDPAEKDATFHITQGYLLQRFMNAAGGRGAQPIKFNGSIFTYGKPDDPDFRRWGGPGFWFMNLRLIYWPMLAAGDFDLMLPWLLMYRDQLPLQKHRTRTYFNHGGAHYPETIMFWGAEVSAHYGWTSFEQRAHPEAECSYVTYYWTGGLELSLILCTYFAYTGDEAVAKEFLIPIADAVTEFYDLHYPRDAEGRLRIEPSQSLETWHDATNPLPDVAGLHYTLPKLLALPEHLTTPTMRQRWSRLLATLPPVPIGQKEGKRVILPADRFDKKTNTENPEMYAVFPFRLYGVGKPNLDLARDTFAVRRHPAHDCWSQDDIQMALLGLTEQAKDWITKRASPASHSDSRFPGFWNAFHDWIPDMDHGGVLQLALQLMLLQHEGRELRLLPAWPVKWNAHFKLHAPHRTVVEARVSQGKVTDLKITPDARRNDLV